MPHVYSQNRSPILHKLVATPQQCGCCRGVTISLLFRSAVRLSAQDAGRPAGAAGPESAHYPHCISSHPPICRLLTPRTHRTFQSMLCDALGQILIQPAVR